MYCFSSTQARSADRYSSSDLVKRRAKVADLVKGGAASEGVESSVVVLLAFNVAWEEVRERTLGAREVRVEGGS